MKKRCLAAPAATLLLALLLFFLYRLYPFADQTLAWCDMKQQVIPFLLDFQNIAAGRADMLLNLQNAGGMSFIGVFFFFISSPFTFLTLFVDASDIYLFANVLVILKMAACSFTASLFFQRRFRELNALQNVALSVMYAFCGYTMLYYQNMVWLDVMAMFPVLLIGADLMIQKQKISCFVLALSAIIVLNFYLTYMVVVFIVLAFGAYLFFFEGNIAEKRKTVLLLGIATFLALLITTAVWLPSLYQYLSSARAVGLYESLTSGNLLTHYFTTLPILLCSGGILAGILMLFGCIGTRRRETAVLFSLWLLTVVPVFIEPVNKMWHTGSYQAFPARYGYITVFLGLILLAQTISALNLQNRGLRYQSASGVAGALLLVVSAGTVSLLLITGKYEELTPYTRTLWADGPSTGYFLIFAGTAVLCYFTGMYLYRNRLLTERVFSVFLCLMVVCEALFSGGVFIGSAANPDAFYRPVFDLSGRIEDTGLYRVKNNRKYFDINLLGGLNYPTLNHYTSLTNKDYMYTMKKLGYSSYWMEVSSHGGTEFTDALLANRYSILRTVELEPDDDPVYDNGTFAIVRSPYAMSFGTVIRSDGISSLERLPDLSRMDIQQSMFERIFHTDRRLVIDYDFSASQNLLCGQGEKTSLIREIPEANGTLSYYIVAEGRQTLYFDCFDQLTNHLSEPIYNSFSISVNGKVVEAAYPRQGSNGILKLGAFADEPVRIKIDVLKDVSAKSFGVFGIDLDALDSAVRQAPRVTLEQKGNTLAGTVTAEGEDRYLLLPLPFEQGYTATVNHKKAEVLHVFDDLMAVRLDNGENEFILTFLPPGLKAGAALSVLGILLFVLLARLFRKGFYRRISWMELPALVLFALLSVFVFSAVYLFPLAVFFLK